MDQKSRGWIFILGALIAGWLAWNEQNHAAIIFAFLFLISGYHHAFGKSAAKRKR